MEMKPQLVFGHVMHKRLFPKVNGFTYGMYYIALPLSKLAEIADGRRFGLDRFGVMSFYRRDHGDRSGGDLMAWARGILSSFAVKAADGEIVLVSLPRVLGYVFNPVSFWLCHDSEGGLRAVICEVNNTFGETHSYLCARSDGQVIGTDDWLEGRKLFHVSPFLKREGHYRFRFAVTDKGFGVWIDFHDKAGDRQLLTALTGTLSPWSRESLRRAFWRYPLVTLKAIGLIHWNAVKLLAKGIRYVPKPLQIDAKHSTMDDTSGGQ